jgi:hypothetical protein
VNLTASYQVFSCDANATSQSGQYFTIQLSAPSSGTVDVAWIGVKPWDTDADTTSLQITPSGTPMTGNHGTGGYVQHSDGTGTSGNCAQFASDGSVTNGPGPCGLGTVQAASQYSPAYYSQSGSSATVGGVTPFTGVGYFSTGGAPAAATGAQIVSAIGSTAVTNATNFTGSLSGDVSGTQTATSVGRINGGAVPASANLVGTNSSSQLGAATARNESVPRTCATTNSGNAYTCTTSPSFTPTAGDSILVNFNAANTGSATLAVNGATAATIKKWGNSSTLAANDVLAGHWISATFDGTY